MGTLYRPEIWYEGQIGRDKSTGELARLDWEEWHTQLNPYSDRMERIEAVRPTWSHSTLITLG